MRKPAAEIQPLLEFSPRIMIRRIISMAQASVLSAAQLVGAMVAFCNYVSRMTADHALVLFC